MLISSGLVPVLRVKATPVDEPLAVVSIKLASVAALPLTEMLSPEPPPLHAVKLRTPVLSL